MADDPVPIELRALVATTALIAIFLVLASVAVFLNTHQNTSEYVALGFVGALSGLVGFAELAQRYRDNAVRLWAYAPSVVYVGVNVAAGIAAFALVVEFQVFYNDAHMPLPHHGVYEVLLASFGAIAFFRSSLFTARVGNANIDVGPATLLKSLLDASDRMINRAQAADRAGSAASIMKGVVFATSAAALSALCMALVENLTADEQKGVADQIATLASPTNVMTDWQRSVVLGAYLIRLVGADVLEQAVDALRT